MATSKSSGICSFCKKKFSKGGIKRHLDSCSARQAAIDKQAAKAKSKQGKTFQIKVEGYYKPLYWLYLEVPVKATLQDLDSFLRNIWLECCGHLSHFIVGPMYYESYPEDEFMDLPFAMMTFNLPRDDNEFQETVGNYKKGKGKFKTFIADFERHREKYSKIKNVEDLVTYFLDKQIDSTTYAKFPFGHRSLSQDFTLRMIERDFRKPLSRLSLDEFLEGLKRFKNYDLTAYGFMADKQSDLSEAIGDVLKVGQKAKYEYDFGSTTALTLTVVSERDGPILRDKSYGEVTLLARNEQPEIPCEVCGKPATWICSWYGFGAVGEGCVCKKHKAGHECDDYAFLPLVNSPRTGVCAYGAQYDDDFDSDSGNIIYLDDYQ